MKIGVKCILAAALAAGLISGVTGCIPKEETKVQVDPNFGAEKASELNLNQLHNDTLEAFGDVNNNPYIYITNVTVDGDINAKVITFNASCYDDATEDEVKQFAAAVVRRAGEAMTVQLPQYEAGDQESFGTCWKDYSIKFEIKNVKDEAVRLTLDIPAGADIELDPDIETYEEEWLEERDRMLETAVYDANGNIVEQ